MAQFMGSIVPSLRSWYSNLHTKPLLFTQRPHYTVSLESGKPEEAQKQMYEAIGEKANESNDKGSHFELSKQDHSSYDE